MSLILFPALGQIPSIHLQALEDTLPDIVMTAAEDAKKLNPAKRASAHLGLSGPLNACRAVPRGLVVGLSNACGFMVLEDYAARVSAIAEGAGWEATAIVANQSALAQITALLQHHVNAFLHVYERYCVLHAARALNTPTASFDDPAPLDLGLDVAGKFRDTIETMPVPMFHVEDGTLETANLKDLFEDYEQQRGSCDCPKCKAARAAQNRELN
ncbi:MAG: hypothetical protein AAGK37_19345 [Pseudomonadota bacterium]